MPVVDTTRTPLPADDRVPTLAAALATALSTHRGIAMRFPGDAGWRELTYPELAAKVRGLARGFVALGVEPGDRIAIMAPTRAEWTWVDLAALRAGAVVVPVYETSSPEEAAYVLDHFGATALVAEDRRQLDALAAAGAGPGAVRARVAMEDAGVGLTLAALEALGAGETDAELDRRAAAVQASDPATIVYTSGTTGMPKGCVLTHGNLATNGDMVLARIPMGPEDVVFAFLPLAHVLTRMTQLTALRAGATLAYWRRDMATVLDDLAEVRPTILPSVPRVFEKAYARAHATADRSRVRRSMLGLAVGVGRDAARARAEGREPSRRLRAAHAVADRVVLHKVRDVFGGRLRFALTGGAPIDPAIIGFFDACGLPVLEGYGMTETSAVATVNTLEQRRAGTVGRAAPGCELRIASDGEVLIRGPHVFAGYHRDPEATAEAFDGDWLRTGDLGGLDADGYLAITGRKKDLIITSSGKNVSPANVENAIRQSPWIGQVVVHGDRRPYLVALVTLDAAEAPALAAAELGLDGALPPAELSRHPAVRRRVEEAVREANARFAPIEQVKRFALLDRELSVEAGELTPTLKVKRAAVASRYAADLERLYGDVAGPADVWLR